MGEPKPRRGWEQPAARGAAKSAGGMGVVGMRYRAAGAWLGCAATWGLWVGTPRSRSRAPAVATGNGGVRGGQSLGGSISASDFAVNVCRNGTIKTNTAAAKTPNATFIPNHSASRPANPAPNGIAPQLNNRAAAL